MESTKKSLIQGLPLKILAPSVLTNVINRLYWNPISTSGRLLLIWNFSPVTFYSWIEW